MKRSTCRLLAGAIMSIAAASAQALKAPEVDLRDPTIWQEKAVSPLTHSPARCSAARTARSGKMRNRIFNVNGSAGNSGAGRMVMKTCGGNNPAKTITRARPGYLLSENQFSPK
ncbi:hypothetical protein SB6414_02705 [Klebsiella pasteurii]|nr:hypothetical protein SB6414_02705 [Klebsiella pasteurii]